MSEQSTTDPANVQQRRRIAVNVAKSDNSPTDGVELVVHLTMMTFQREPKHIGPEIETTS